MSARPAIRVRPTLSATEVASALGLADAAARADGSYPLSEHVVLHLRHGGGHSLHLLAEDQPRGALLGYAHLDLSDAVEGPAAELAVCPGARRRGIGSALLDAAERQTHDLPGPLRIWAHGSSATAHDLATTRGFRRTRQLWQMRRSLYSPLARARPPAGVSLRPFDPTADIDAWLALNAATFHDLPDQGGWTRADLERRMVEPWFDPAGLVIAQTADQLVGYHWTKIHGHGGPGQVGLSPAHEPIGEVYVLGVAPPARGRGLGRCLAVAGLRHLRDRGLASALLYVEADNAPAIALYRSLGFALWDTDTLFRR